MWLAAAVSLLAVSCVVAEPEQEQAMTDAPEITATLGQDSPATKLSVAESNGSTREVFWEKFDRIAVFMHNKFASLYVLEGEGGQSSGKFKCLLGKNSGKQFPEVFGAYPYSRVLGCDGSTLGMVFPSEQVYRENAFDPNANLMVAVSQTNKLPFKNVGGYLVLRLYGADVEVSKVVVNGNDGEALAGRAEVKISEGEAPEIESAAMMTATEVSLVCPTPVKLGATAADATEFWFVLPPVTLEKGLTVTVYGEDGTFTRSAQRAVTIARSSVYRLESEVELLVEPDYVEMAPGLKIAKKNVGAATPEDIGDYFAWGETAPKETFTYSNYIFGNVYEGTLTKYTMTDGLYELEPEDDAATVNLGEGWCMPSNRVFNWLLNPDNCTWTAVTHTGDNNTEVAGYECVSKVSGYEGNTLFFPCSGISFDGQIEDGDVVFLWTSKTDDLFDKLSAYSLIVSSEEKTIKIGHVRSAGMPVRAICGKPEVTAVSFAKDSYQLLPEMYLFQKVVAEPRFAEDKNEYVWESSDESVATVNEYGVVKALAAGTTTITATATGDAFLTASCTVTVGSTPDPSWLLGTQWENSGCVLDFGRTLPGFYIPAAKKSGVCSYTNSDLYRMYYRFVNYAGWLGFSSYKNDTTEQFYLIAPDTDSSIYFWDVSNWDTTHGTFTASSKVDNYYTQVSPAIDLTLSDVTIKLGTTVYPMWTLDDVVDCHTGFMSGVMGGQASETIPLEVIKNGTAMGYGHQEDYQDFDTLSGKIVVVRRGELSFAEKLDYAAAKGAIAVLVVNNNAGLVHANLSGTTASIPLFVVPQEAYSQLMEVDRAVFELAETPSTAYLR